MTCPDFQTMVSGRICCIWQRRDLTFGWLSKNLGFFGGRLPLVHTLPW
jgi:hypothetical protein